VAARLSAGLPERDVARIADLFRRTGLPVTVR